MITFFKNSLIEGGDWMSIRCIKSIGCLYLLIILLTGILEGCSDTPVEKQEFHMGTIITEKVYGKNALKSSDEVMKRIGQLESMMTINTAGSEIDKLDSMAGKEAVKLSQESIYLLETSKKYSELSGGAFDITVGPLVKAWGIYTDAPRVPEKAEIEALLKLVGYTGISIDKNNMTAKLEKSGQVVDLGAIAKGYAGDEAIKIFKDNGVKSAYINLGGNVVVLGTKPDGKPWKVGVQNPRAENGSYIGILQLADKAVVTSGDYERFFEKDSVRYHHILDPKTGYPSASDLISTTIIADSSTDADALSTATFVLGLDKGMEIIRSLKGVEAVFITKDKKVYATDGLKDIFTFDDESKEFEYVEKR